MRRLVCGDEHPSTVQTMQELAVLELEEGQVAHFAYNALNNMDILHITR